MFDEPQTRPRGDAGTATTISSSKTAIDIGAWRPRRMFTI